MAAGMIDSFGTTRAPVKMYFIDEEAFNAYASSDDDCYILELGKPVPLFLLILFERILSDPRLFPWLPTTGEIVTDYEVAFIFDPADFAGREKWKINLTELRSFTAGILADITVAFVQMHELGHVMCGHIEANRHLTGRRAMVEMVAEQPPSRLQVERERAWEADADAVAASFLVRYLTELVEQTEQNNLAALAFGGGKQTIEHVLSVTVVALYAMFSYFRGARYRIGKRSSHPHPLVRSFYVKDMLITAARREWTLDLEVLGELIDQRLDEMLIALEAVGLSKNHLFNDRYLSRTEKEVAYIMDIRAKHRRSCLQWAWFPWTNSKEFPSG
jgi:hypothetical protein